MPLVFLCGLVFLASRSPTVDGFYRLVELLGLALKLVTIRIRLPKVAGSLFRVFRLKDQVVGRVMIVVVARSRN